LSIEAHRKHALPAHSLVPCSLLFTLCNVNEYPDRNVTGFPRAQRKHQNKLESSQPARSLQSRQKLIKSYRDFSPAG